MVTLGSTETDRLPGFKQCNNREEAVVAFSLGMGGSGGKAGATLLLCRCETHINFPEFIGLFVVNLPGCGSLLSG